MTPLVTIVVIITIRSQESYVIYGRANNPNLLLHLSMGLVVFVPILYDQQILRPLHMPVNET